MQDLIKQEQFELEVLDRLNSEKLLTNLVFCGGSMLRLCHGLNRFSIDLDFWIVKNIDASELFLNLKDIFSRNYTIKDSAEKFNTLLFELKSPKYPRNLKLEIRIWPRKVGTEPTIAYSKYSNIQVLVRSVLLKEMMKAKIEAFNNRKEIRDVFDIEFLIKKGIDIDTTESSLKNILNNIDSLSSNDYKIKLGSLLEGEQRRYYIRENFKILKSAIRGLIK